MMTPDKIIYTVSILWAIVLSVAFALQYNKTEKLKFRCAQLEIQLEERNVRISKAEALIEKQNNAIMSERVDTVMLKKELKVITRAYADTREKVTEIIKQDTGCENKINVIDGLMRGFCNGDGGGLLSKSRNENGR